MVALSHTHLVAEVSERVVLVRLTSVLRGHEARPVSQALLAEVKRVQARHVLLDLTGAEKLSDDEINALVNLATATGLLGAKVRLTGVSASLAQQLQASAFEVGELLSAHELAAIAALPTIEV